MITKRKKKKSIVLKPIEKVTFKQHLTEGVSEPCRCLWEECSGWKNSQCKGPGVDGASVAGVE